MNAGRKITKTEGVLLGLTTIFLCSLLMLYVHDCAEVAATGVETEHKIPQEEFMPDIMPLDLNTADVDDLDELPGIGEALASRILEYRKEHGRFQSVEELLEISGIGEKTLAEIQERVTVNGGNADEDSGRG